VNARSHTPGGWTAAASEPLRQWSALVLLGAALSSGCDTAEPPPSRGRSDKVTASGTATAKARASASASAAKPAPPRRQLCPSRELQPAPGKIAAARSVTGAPQLPALRFGKGRWQWLNVWAAWCKPCKEEMPRLIEWRDKLRATGVPLDLIFLSIDDDEREMMRFMRAQPKTGVRASYWLEAEDDRAKWFESIGFDDTPELPVHALVSPAGKLTCVIKGAMNPSDYPQLAAVFTGKDKP